MLVCIVSGPLFARSDTWLPAIDSGTIIVRFLTVFLIRNSQTRHAAAMQVKPNEPLRAVEAAHASSVSNDMADERIEALRTALESESGKEKGGPCA